MNLYKLIKERFADLITYEYIWSSQVGAIRTKPLTLQEVIGNPDRKDFPLLKGKEIMVQANFRGSLGQACTDQTGNFQGTLKPVK